VVVVASDPEDRTRLWHGLQGRPGLEVVAWAEDVEALLVLAPRCDLVLTPLPVAGPDEAALRARGTDVRVVGPGEDPSVTTARWRAGLPAPAPARRTSTGTDGPPRPDLAPRQREVMVAYAAGNELLPTVARRLGVDEETVKTHLRRIRRKYADVGRPAPTRRDLYVRAVEDGLLPPPTGSAPD
jgi:DNA-binding CsgD family transcriptional regulator